MGEKWNVYSLLEGEPRGKRPLRTPRLRWINNIKKGLVEIKYCSVD
jgi:hypothetical protein